MCAIEQPPVMRGSMLTRMVSNTAWGNSSFTPRLKPSLLFCLPLSVNISLSPGTDSGVNTNQIMHTNISVTQDFQQSFCLSLSHTHSSARLLLHRTSINLSLYIDIDIHLYLYIYYRYRYLLSCLRAFPPPTYMWILNVPVMC